MDFLLIFVLAALTIFICILIMHGFFLAFTRNFAVALLVIIFLTPIFICWAFIEGLLNFINPKEEPTE